MRLALCATLGLATGCSSHDADQWRDIAARANPVIQRLREPAAVVLDPTKRSDVQAVASACLAGIEAAKPMAAIHFHDASAGTNLDIGIDDVMFMFGHDTHNYCVEGQFDADCVDFCVDRYDELADAIDRIRDKAAKAGVDIESLRK